MRRPAAIAVTVLALSLLIAPAANALVDHYRIGDEHELIDARIRAARPEPPEPTWSPTWTPTWTPEPQLPDPTPTYSAAVAGATYDSVPTGCLSDAEIAAYARAAGFPESAIPTMVYIAAHRGSSGTGESGGCPGAINPSSGACGLWQIYPAQPGCTDPATNAALAYAKYQDSGFSPWGG